MLEAKWKGIRGWIQRSWMGFIIWYMNWALALEIVTHERLLKTASAISSFSKSDNWDQQSIP